jgi:rubrerythrin
MGGIMNTTEHLAQGFIGESMARNRYTMYAKAARLEGYEQIAALFLETAENERIHAKWFFNMMNEAAAKQGVPKINVDSEVPNVLGNTAMNLKAAIAGEHHEYAEMYPEIAEVAEKEGFGQFANRVRAIMKAEFHHEGRYKKLLDVVENGTVFRKGNKIYWVCRECGYIHEGTEPPLKCPSCDNPRAFFQVQSENY